MIVNQLIFTDVFAVFDYLGKEKGWSFGLVSRAPEHGEGEGLQRYSGVGEQGPAEMRRGW